MTLYVAYAIAAAFDGNETVSVVLFPMVFMFNQAFGKSLKTVVIIMETILCILYCRRLWTQTSVYSYLLELGCNSELLPMGISRSADQ